MDTIELGGADPIQVSRVIHGAMAPRFGVPHDVQRASLRAALDAGVTTVDTAPVYDFGRSEQLVGEEIAGRRRGLQILTKVGLRWDGEHGRVLFRGPGTDGLNRTVRCDSRPAAVRRDVEQSLTRLGVDVLDLVQVHHPDEDTPIAETMGALLELRSEGKLRAIGVSNFRVDQVLEAAKSLGSVGLASHQLRYHLMDRAAEQELLPLARKRNHGVLAFSPLSKGWLGGGRRPKRSQTQLRDALDLLKETAASRGASPAQVALAWLLAQPGLSAVIAGASSPEQASNSAESARIDLSPDERNRLAAAFFGLVPDERPDLAKRLFSRARRLASRASHFVRGRAGGAH